MDMGFDSYPFLYCLISEIFSNKNLTIIVMLFLKCLFPPHP